MALPPLSQPIIMAGNPVDGFRCIGPFGAPSEAIEWATSHCAQDWTLTDLLTPKGYADAGEG